MGFRNLFTENIIFPLSDKLTGQFNSKHLKFLLKSQWWSEDELTNYQNKKLRLLIAHAYENVPFYRELFDDLKLKPQDIQTKEDLTKLPIISKEDLKKASGKHLAKNINKKQLLYRSSSGSTGEPFQFYKTKYAESFLKAAAIRAWYWMGYRLGDKYVKISMNPRSSVLKKIQDRINNCLYLSSTQLTQAVFNEIAESIIRFNPKIIRCYPVPLMFLSNQVEKLGKKNLFNELKAINTTGSSLSKDYRNLIEKVFNVNIFDSYSCEGGTVFSQCSKSSYYHPADEYAISEFIEDEFSASHIKHPLRHITTDLINYASPFIRYDTQDYIVLGAERKCDCGRRFKNVEGIMGRDSDIIRTPSGKFLIVENFVAYFEWIPEVDQIQVVQEEISLIKINMVVNNSFNKDIMTKIQNYWQEYIGYDVKVEIKIVSAIELTPTGKRRTVIRNPKISLTH